MDRESIIRKAQEEFAERLNSELDRIELMKQEAEPKGQRAGSCMR